MVAELAAKYRAIRGRVIVLAEPRAETTILLTGQSVATRELFSPRPHARKATVVSSGVRELRAGDAVWVKPDPQLAITQEDGRELWFYGASKEDWKESVYGKRTD